MRQSFHRLEMITLKDGTPVGISLGFSHCAEHESGIQPLFTALSLDDTRPGVDRFLARGRGTNDRRLSFYERTRATKTIPTEARLSFHLHDDNGPDLGTANPKCGILPQMPHQDGAATAPLAAAWDEVGFCVRAFGGAEQNMVRRLHHAAIEGDLLISIGDGLGTPFARGGLCLTLRSAVPDEINEQVIAAQQDQMRLTAAKEDTAIEALLRSAGCTYHALKPAWTKDIKIVRRAFPGGEKDQAFELETKHPVVFFLNPAGHDANFGWYTVEELAGWAEGRGPIPKVA